MSEGQNNPLDVERNGTQWVGLLPGDGKMADFDSLVDGVRAGMISIIAAFRTHGCTTVYDMLRRFAPPSDGNPTRAYARFVGNRLGLRPGVPGDPEPGDCVAITSPETLKQTAAAMAWWEQHAVIPVDVLQAAAKLALEHIGIVVGI